MELLDQLLLGLSTAATLNNFLYCLAGCVLGTMVGILPGVGPAPAIAMLLPMTFTLDPAGALIMIAGIYYGAQYGGSTTAILVNLPGESSSVVTAIDGHQMARQGKAGLALQVAAIGSFVAGCFATLMIALFAPILTAAALRFSAPEYFSLMLLGLIASIVLAHGSVMRAIGMCVLGLLIGTIGIDLTTGTHRFDFGMIDLSDGIDIVAVAVGMFGLGEVIHELQNGPSNRKANSVPFRDLIPRFSLLRPAVKPIIRGSLIGSVLGILPGGGALLSAFASYAVEKKLAKDPTRFGKGAIEGVAGPESANNAGAQTSFVPLLTLGLPSNPIMALMAGAMIVHGLQPGPAIARDQPEIFWGVIASMWIGNLMLLVLNLPLVGIWVKLLSVPYKMLYPAILIFCGIGVFTLNNSAFDIYVMVFFGLLGYVFRILGAEPAPLLLGIILGPIMEENLRRAMLMGRGDPMVFIERPISATLLIIAILALIIVAIPAVSRKKDVALQEE